jgi:phosphoribosylanthranilate isomerase
VRRTRVKICGLTRVEDVSAAVAAGADAVGFVFADSPRCVALEQAAELSAVVPFPVARVGVFVDATYDELTAAIEGANLSAVQLCGAESVADIDRLSVPVIKVVHVGTAFGYSEAEPYRGHAAALLLDTYHPQSKGGTSHTFHWQSVGEAPGWAPFVVAGGLHAGNVGDAIAAMRPFAVDVSSGVEFAPGIKDHSRIEAFCAAVRAADEEVYAR